VSAGLRSAIRSGLRSGLRLGTERRRGAPALVYSVSALLHFDGEDESTDFADATGKVWTPSGDARIDTAQAKFGPSSGYFDGIGDVITTPAHDDLTMGAGDYTYAGWVRPTAIGGDQCILDGRAADAEGLAIYASVSSGGASGLTAYNNVAKLAGGVSGDLPSGEWTYFSVCRRDGVVYGHAAGQPTFSAADARTLEAAVLCVGTNYVGTQGFAGHLDDLLVVKGTALYEDGVAYEPPTAAHPDPEVPEVPSASFLVVAGDESGAQAYACGSDVARTPALIETASPFPNPPFGTADGVLGGVQYDAPGYGFLAAYRYDGAEPMTAIGDPIAMHATDYPPTDGAAAVADDRVYGIIARVQEDPVESQHRVMAADVDGETFTQVGNIFTRVNAGGFDVFHAAAVLDGHFCVWAHNGTRDAQLLAFAFDGTDFTVADTLEPGVEHGPAYPYGDGFLAWRYDPENGYTGLLDYYTYTAAGGFVLAGSPDLSAHIVGETYVAFDVGSSAFDAVTGRLHAAMVDLNFELYGILAVQFTAPDGLAKLVQIDSPDPVSLAWMVGAQDNVVAHYHLEDDAIEFGDFTGTAYVPRPADTLSPAPTFFTMAPLNMADPGA
jgi:hypothetical protein